MVRGSLVASGCPHRQLAFWLGPQPSDAQTRFGPGKVPSKVWDAGSVSQQITSFMSCKGHMM